MGSIPIRLRSRHSPVVARAIAQAAPGALPDSPPDAFGDDTDSVHQKAIDQLAAAGIVGGTGGGSYSPGRPVTRGQRATFLANAAAYVLGRPLPADRDVFADDNGTLFEADVNRVAGAGLASGLPDGTYGPGRTVQRDQMGSFLARLLEPFVDHGSRPPS